MNSKAWNPKGLGPKSIAGILSFTIHKSKARDLTYSLRTNENLEMHLEQGQYTKMYFCKNIENYDFRNTKNSKITDTKISKMIHSASLNSISAKLVL